MNEPTRVTNRQDEYLKQLSTGPKTTRDLLLALMVSGKSVNKMLKKLRDAGMISKRKCIQGNTHVYALITPYADMNIVVITGNRGSGRAFHAKIPKEEILYAAELRNPLYSESGVMIRPGLLGRRLIEEYHKKYPNRLAITVLNTIVPIAKRRKLCR